MYDVDNRLSSVDLSVPGGRYVIASDDNGTINPGAQELLPLIPIPYVTSEEAGWGRGLMDPSAVRLAPRVGFALALDDSRAVIRGGYGIFLNQWAYSVQTAFARNLPFFYTKQVDVPAAVRVPTLETQNILATNATGTIAPTHHGLRLQRRIQPDVERRSAVRAVSDHDGGSLLHGDLDARR